MKEVKGTEVGGGALDQVAMLKTLFVLGVRRGPLEGGEQRSDAILHVNGRILAPG